MGLVESHSEGVRGGAKGKTKVKRGERQHDDVVLKAGQLDLRAAQRKHNK